MKTFTLIFIFVFLAACQTKTENVAAETIKIVEIQPFVSPTGLSSAMPLITVNDIKSKIGTVDVTKNREVCLTIQNSDLKEDDEVSIVFAENTQSVIAAKIQNKLSSSCSRNTEVNLDDSFYLLKLSKPANEIVYLAFGLISSNNVAVKNGVASIDLDGDKKPEYFRECTSMEGVHLTVWTGKPLNGKRIWHNYYYLGYDTEPSCEKKDYEGTEE